MKRRDPKAPCLVPVVYIENGAKLLWDLLAERPPEANISHKEMPTWEEHVAFVKRHPYRRWHFIRVEGEFVGSVYITRHFEIGVAIFKAHQGKGYGKFAVSEMVRMWGSNTYARVTQARKQVYANIAPGNVASQEFFERLGFRHIQNVYALDIPEPPGYKP